MCGIFGYLNYGSVVKDTDLKEILKSLAHESTVRGMDATGIAFANDKGSIEIQKAPKPAYSFKMNLCGNMPKAVIGHTRHTTQGSEKVNINNHPFYGKAGRNVFALAHNGILYNDEDLRQEYNFPKSKIETDSYVAIQLLEQEKQLNMAAIKKMSEAVQGSFVFTILDGSNNLYIVKGDNPVTIIHHKKLKLYLYASTDKILASAIAASTLLYYFTPTKRNAGDIELVDIDDGDIVKIDSRGKVNKGTFKQSKFHMGFYDWPFHGGRYSRGRVAYDVFNPGKEPDELTDIDFNYLEGVKSVAKSIGYSEDMVDFLLDEGLTLGEIEEYLYQDTCF